MAVAGLALLAMGLSIGWQVSRHRGEDFGHLYVVGRMILDGTNVYDAVARQAAYRAYCHTDAQWGMFYPPSSGVAVLPLASLPYAFARVAWYLLLAVSVGWGVWCLLAAFAPDWGAGARLLVVGLVMCASSVRWGFQLLQTGPLILGLLCLFTVALAQERRGAAFAWGALTACLKVTFALPFLALALLQRRWVLAAGVIAVWALANGIGFTRMGGSEALQGYRRDMAQFERPGEPNYPDPRLPNSHERLDWPFLFNAVSPDLPRSRALGLALTALFAAWLLVEARRACAIHREPVTLAVFVGPFVGLSMLCVYHHRYDSVVALAPLLLYLAHPRLRKLPGVPWFVIPVLLYAGLYPVFQVQLFAERYFGAASALVLKPIGSVVFTIALAASLVSLRRHLANRLAHEDAASLSPVGGVAPSD